MLAVNDLFYLAKPIVESLFFEDVVAWLDANEIRYTPKVKFTGIRGFDRLFNFVWERQLVITRETDIPIYNNCKELHD